MISCISWMPISRAGSPFCIEHIYATLRLLVKGMPSWRIITRSYMRDSLQFIHGKIPTLCVGNITIHHCKPRKLLLCSLTSKRRNCVATRCLGMQHRRGPIRVQSRTCGFWRTACILLTNRPKFKIVSEEYIHHHWIE